MKYLLCSFIAAVIFNLTPAALAQEVPVHTKKVYQSAEGKLYWPKDLPVFIRLSASAADTAQSYLMESEKTAEYTNPYYLDTEGINYIRSKWAVDPKTREPVYPQFEVLWEVYRDGTPPVSKMIVNDDQKSFRRKGVIYLSEAAKISFSGQDVMSGVEAIYFSIDEQPYQKFVEPLNLESEKEYLIKSYGVDNTGNVEKVQQQKIILDFSAPSSKASVKGSYVDQILSGKNKILLSSTDLSSGVASIHYQIDSLEKKKFQHSIRLSNLEEGEHSLTFYAADSLNNQEQRQVFQFYIDNTPPIITSDLLGDSFIANGKEYSSGRTRVKLTAIDNKAGVQKVYYSIDGEDYQEYEKPFFLPARQGDITITYYAIDEVGNKSENTAGTDATFTSPYLDLTAPRLSHQFIGDTFLSRDTVFINTQTKIKLQGNDSESGMKNISYQYDGATDSIYSEPFTIKDAGLHELNMVGYDNVNNSNSHRFFFYVDDEAPEINTVFSIKPFASDTINGELLPVLPAHTELFLAATDNQVGLERIEYIINNQDSQQYSSALSGFTRNQVYQVDIEVADKLGNQNSHTLKFLVK